MTFNPITSTLGGLFLALSVLFFSSIFGRVLGISGFIGAIVENPAKSLERENQWRWYFLFGMMLGGWALADNESLALSSPVSSTSTLVLSGFLVGAGTSIGRGCTSGHGLCGLSRISPRSIAAVLTFMLSAMSVQSTIRIMSGTAFHMKPLETSYGVPSWVYSTFYGFLVFFVLIFLVGPQIRNQATFLFLTQLSSFVVGVAFAIGLMVSGMSNPYKVLDFLSLPTLLFPKVNTEAHNRFDPSLILVMMGGLVPNLVLFPLIINYLPKPRMGHVWQFPTLTMINTSLILGAMLFGAGWGLVGLCPGPAVVVFPSVAFGMNLWLLPWWGGFISGMILGKRCTF